MKKVVKSCLAILFLLLFVGGIAVIITAITIRPEKETEQSTIEPNATDVAVDSVVGVSFKIPNNWVLSETEYSQCTICPSLVDYHNDSINAISITSSWVTDDFNVKDYADTFCDALGESSTVADVGRASYKINGYAIEEITVINNGAFGGYCYLKKGNVIVEILYGTDSPDNVGVYREKVNAILSTMVFKDGVKEDDFPKVPEESKNSSSDTTENSEKAKIDENAENAEKSEVMGATEKSDITNDNESKPDTTESEPDTANGTNE